MWVCNVGICGCMWGVDGVRLWVCGYAGVNGVRCGDVWKEYVGAGEGACESGECEPEMSWVHVGEVNDRLADGLVLELWGMWAYCGLLWESWWHIGTACTKKAKD